VGDFTFVEPDVVIGVVIVIPWFPNTMIVCNSRDVIPQIARGVRPFTIPDQGYDQAQTSATENR
jgi:hypothetical protein